MTIINLGNLGNEPLPDGSQVPPGTYQQQYDSESGTTYWRDLNTGAVSTVDPATMVSPGLSPVTGGSLIVDTGSYDTSQSLVGNLAVAGRVDATVGDSHILATVSSNVSAFDNLISTAFAAAGYPGYGGQQAYNLIMGADVSRAETDPLGYANELLASVGVPGFSSFEHFRAVNTSLPGHDHPGFNPLDPIFGDTGLIDVAGELADERGFQVLALTAIGGAALSEALASNAFTAGVAEEAAALGIGEATGVTAESIAVTSGVVEEAAALGIPDAGAAQTFTLAEEAAMLGVESGAPQTFSLAEETAMLGIADTGTVSAATFSFPSLPSIPGIISPGGGDISEIGGDILGGEGGGILSSLPDFDDLFSRLAPHLQNELMKYLRGTPQQPAIAASPYTAGFGGDIGGMSPLAKAGLALAAGAMIAIPLRGSLRGKVRRRSRH